MATDREAHYVLDEILGNATDLPITEHATDTHGVTLVKFALFDLVGLQFSPRIRDLGKITLYRSGAKATTERAWPTAGPLLARRLDLDLIAEHWDELLRLAASMKFGHATRRWWWASCPRRAGRTPWPPRSRSTAPCAVRSTPPTT